MCLSLFFGAIFSPPVRAGPRKPAQKVQPCVSLWRSLRGLARVSGELWRLRTGLPGECLRGFAWRCVTLRLYGNQPLEEIAPILTLKGR